MLEGVTNPSGVTIASLVVDGSITDPDGSAVEAIAITGLNTSLGTWQFSLDGGTSWLMIQADLINSQTNELALLLGPTAQLRLIPFGDLNGSVSDAITFRAWDQTSGSEGQYVEITTTGGSTAYSSATETAAITVTAINDAPTFLTGEGKVTTALGLGVEEGTSVTLQADGKILVAGYSWNGSNNDFSLIRLNVDGSLDTSFDSDGKLILPVGSGNDLGHSVTIQADGKILVAGNSHNGSNYDFALVRYNSDGSLDTSVDGDGKLTTAVGSDVDAFSVTLQADGKILVAGYIYNGSDYEFAVVRYNSDASLDTSFDGNVIVNITAVNDAAVAMADTAIAVEAGGIANATDGTNPTGNVLNNDTDPDASDTKTVIGVSAGVQPSGVSPVSTPISGTFGSITIAADGSYTYTVDNDNPTVQALRTSSDTLTDTFTYTMQDAAGLISTTQITVTIQGANDAVNDIGLALQSGINFVTNGSFETNTGSADSPNPGATATGWTAIGIHGLEIWNNFGGPTASDGITKLELDVGSDLDGLFQNINTINNVQYLLSFDFSSRNGGADVVEVYWRGQLVETITSSTLGFQT